MTLQYAQRSHTGSDASFGVIGTVEVLERAMLEERKKLSESTVALLGLSHKANVSDTREISALQIHDILVKKGAAVRTFDPHISRTTAKTLDDALQGVDAAIVLAGHAEFRALTPLDFKTHDVQLVVDGRNCLDKNAFKGSGVTYRSIGR